jgi:hypothetical protein
MMIEDGPVISVTEAGGLLGRLPGSPPWTPAAVEIVHRLGCGLTARLVRAGRLVVQGARAAGYPEITEELARGLGSLITVDADYTWLEARLVGLSAGQLSALQTLAQTAGPIPVAALGLRLGLSRAGVGNLVSRLAERGLVGSPRRGQVQLLPAGLSRYLRGPRQSYLEAAGGEESAESAGSAAAAG